jgi:hypothetical protein
MIALDGELAASIEGLYAVFARYPRPREILTDGLTITAERPMLARPLREVAEMDLGEYPAKAMTTQGTVDDYRYFAPRILELAAFNMKRPAEPLQSTLERIATIGFPISAMPPEMLLGKLAYAEWHQWPADEQAAVRGFLQAWWKSLLSSYPTVVEADSLLCGIARCDDLRVYLQICEAMCCKVGAARCHLAHLISVHLTEAQTRREAWLPLWFDLPWWSEHPVRLVQFYQWLFSETVALLVDEAAVRAVGDEDYPSGASLLEDIRRYRELREGILRYVEEGGRPG